MKKFSLIAFDILLILVLIVGAWLRLTGVNWDESQHLHPDERFLTMVESSLEPVNSISEYFDTANSTLNPHNRGYGFFVYGTLPIFIVRYVAEALGKADYDNVTLVGRQLSALADLGAIFLIYLIVAKLYNKRTALLTAAFASVSVMLIQQSHFFTVDTFTNFFMFLTIYFAVNIMLDRRGDEAIRGAWYDQLLVLIKEPLVLNVIGFGVALGMSVASKINAAPLAILLPGALIVRWFADRVSGVRDQLSVASDRLSGVDGQSSVVNDQSSVVNDQSSVVNRQSETVNRQSSIDERLLKMLVLLFVGAFFALFAFRVFQPYAFKGEFGFMDVRLNEAWVANMSEIRAQSSGDVDFPPALQWARRSRLFSFENLTIWGLGLPLGILAWTGFIYMGWRIFRGEWKQHALLWGWTLAYFGWQSLAWNSTMRYQLPIYPLLAMMAAWLVFNVERSNAQTFKRWVLYVVGALVLIASFVWAYAFVNIYRVPHTRVAAARWIYQNVPGPINVEIDQADGSTRNHPLTFIDQYVIQPGTSYESQFSAPISGSVDTITFGHAVDPYLVGEQTITFTLWTDSGRSPDQIAAQSIVNGNFIAQGDPRGELITLTLDRSVQVEKDQNYYFRIEANALTLKGAGPINESSWDDGLPLRMDGYDGYGGIYQGELNLELYWDDNADKYQRFIATLDQGDYIFISSNRQWATTTRVPERYPLTSAYYRALIGCPEDKEIIWCYNVAKPGMFTGQLGYELMQTFESYPTFAGVSINDQFAEEAFSVYDHPKVLLFQKTDQYNPDQVRAILGAVDLSRVVHLTPKQAGAPLRDLLMTPEQKELQSAGGTWSDLFSYESIQNKYPVIGLIIWYLFIAIIGLFTYPLVRLILPGLADKGYPVSRIVGLVLLAYFAWIVASLGGTYDREVIALGVGLIVIGGSVAAFFQRAEIADEIRSRGKYFLIMEAIFLVFFLIDLGIRIGNPDLWHPGHGGERPMDFSYLNAIIRSTVFPPYDPWFAGGYINYYYWGFVIVGTPIKLLGIVPSIAYNFVLPTLFAIIGMGAFSIAFNLVASYKLKVESEDLQPSTFNLQLFSGLAASAGMILIGNLGTIRMIFQGLQRIIVSYEEAVNPSINIFQHWAWAFQGLIKMIGGGATLPYGFGDWYWYPSRVIPAPNDVEPITEFPLFTFLYSDLHAHMIVLTLTTFVILWAVSILSAKAQWKNLGAMIGSFIVGGIFIGALRPTNTWDFPTYLALAAIVTFYAIVKNHDQLSAFDLPKRATQIGLGLIGAGALIAVALIAFMPYAYWYALGYSEVNTWQGSHTPLGSYLTQWLVFLFPILFWMGWETREWMAATPMSALKKIKAIWIEIALALLVFAILLLSYLGVWIAWFVLPIAFWALILLLRPDQPDVKRIVLFMIGTSLLLTLIVELIVLVGDIGRMNTVFKFYLQAWTMLAVSAGAAFGWTLIDLPRWKFNFRAVWQIGLYALFAGAIMFTITGSMDKIRNRWIKEAPRSLDSMEYMQYADYFDQNVSMILAEDYRAIRWLQENAQGSPVTVEASIPEYRWGTRMTIYTGLPTVIGWNWHQRQQRAATNSEWVTQRVDAVREFYTTNDVVQTLGFLKKYEVTYIIVGQVERAYYTGEGLMKFELYNNQFWTEVFRDGQTVIYEVK